MSDETEVQVIPTVYDFPALGSGEKFVVTYPTGVQTWELHHG